MLNEFQQSAHRFMLHACTEWAMPAVFEAPRILLMHRVNRSDRVHHQTVSRVRGAPLILTSHEEGPFRVWYWWEMQRSA